MEDTIWHEIHNAYRTRKMLTGYLGGVEQTDNGKTIAIVEYKGFRVVIPLREMMISLGDNTASGSEYDELMRRQNKVLSNMLGAEIDKSPFLCYYKNKEICINRIYPHIL